MTPPAAVARVPPVAAGPRRPGVRCSAPLAPLPRWHGGCAPRVVPLRPTASNEHATTPEGGFTGLEGRAFWHRRRPRLAVPPSAVALTLALRSRTHERLYLGLISHVGP